MTDTLAGGPVPSSASPAAPTPPPLASPPPDAANAIQSTLVAAPELVNDPGTAVAVAATGGTPVVAQSVTQAGKRQANAIAQNRVTASGGGGLFGDISHAFGDALHAVAHAANVGLSTVQQEYRYLHDVEARHGMGAAMLEGAGILAGAAGGGVAGFFAGGQVAEGIALGAEGAARLEGQFTYKDSWARAANPNYRDPHTGQLVSFGRDVTNLLGLQGGTKTVASGVLDGIGDLVADPLALGGKVIGAQRTVAITADNVERAFNNPLSGFRAAAADIARSDSGQIAAHYPQFVSISGTLGAAHTAEDVKNVFRDFAGATEMLDATKYPSTVAKVDENGNRVISEAGGQPLEINALNLPTLAPGHKAVRALGEAAGNMGTNRGDWFANHIANNVLVGPATWSRRLAKLPGSTFDRGSMDISGTQINPANTNGALDFMNTMRYALSPREVQAVGQSYIDAAGPAERIIIVKNGIMRTLSTMAGIPMPPPGEMPDWEAHLGNYLDELNAGDVKQKIWERLNNHMVTANAEGVPPERIFGVIDGKNIRPVYDENGELQGGITENQVGHISLPDLVQARRMAQAIRSSKASRVLAGTDDFLYDHITQGFFKPLVLMSGGYGLHISLAEAIPNALRHGLGQTAKTLYERTIASLGYKADQGELNGLSGWLWHMGGERAFNNSEEAQRLTAAYILMEGHKVTPGLGAGEALNGEINQTERAAQAFRQGVPVGYRTGNTFGLFGSSDKRFPRMWQAALREGAKSDWTRVGANAYRDALAQGMKETAATEYARQAVVDRLSTEPQSVLDNFVREQLPMRGSPATWTPMDGHAQAVVENMKNLVHAPGEAEGASGKLHMDFLNSLGNGHTPALGDIEAIDASERPLMVKGREVVPDGMGTVQRIANFGFRKILNPMVNMISRHQEFAAEYLPARAALQEKIDAGVMTEDQAVTTAMAQATQHSMRFVHNLHDRTQWTATMRNWAPFYFAQEQAYRRMGRLLAEDPGAFRRYQLMISGVHDLAVNQQDSNGNKYIAFPGSGFLGKGVADLMGESGLSVGNVSPAAFGGSFSSANVIFPLSQGVKPDLGPVVIIPAMGLSSIFSELGKNYGVSRPIANVAANALADVAGQQAMSSGVLQQLIPNAFVGRMVEAFQGNDRAFNSSVMQAYQLADYQQAKATEDWIRGGRKGPAPQLIPPENAPAPVRQAFQDKIKNMVRMLYIARAITGMVSPVSSAVEMQNFGFPAKLNAAITKAGSVSAGMQQFILDNPDALPYTVAQSYVPANTGGVTQPSGYSLASSQPAMDWVNQNQAGLSKYGQAFMWLMPQLTDSKYSPTVYNEQIAQGLRVKDTPDQFLNSLYVAAGNNVYYAGLTIHENNLAAAGNNSVAKNAEYNSWNQWVTTLEKQHPVWAEDYLSPTKQVNRMQAIQTLQSVYAAGDAPQTAQSDLVYQLLQNYQQAAAEFQAAGNQRSYSTQLTDQKAVQDAWIAYTDNLETAVPALKPIIQTVFKEALVVKT